MQEPIREPQQPLREERGTVRPPEPLRYTGPTTYAGVESFRARDLVHWAPTWGGMFVTLGVLLLLGTLGAAIGLGSVAAAGAASSIGAGAAIWSAIIVIVAFFVGGWFAGRTISLISPLVASAHGALVWSITLVFTLLVTLTGLGASLASIAGLTGLPTGTAVTAATAQGPAWATFIILLLGLAACVAGAIVGNQAQMALPTNQRQIR